MISVISELSEKSDMFGSITADINNVCMYNNHKIVYHRKTFKGTLLCASKRHYNMSFVSLFNIMSHGSVPISFLSATIMPIQIKSIFYISNLDKL